jgi:excisionase family DNA binding protein
MKNENELIGSAEAAKLLGIERTTLYQWTSRKQIPFVRISRNLIKFRLADIQALVESKYVEAIGGQAEKSPSATRQEPRAEQKRAPQEAGSEASRRPAKGPSKDRPKREDARRTRKAKSSGSSKAKDILYEQGFMKELGIRPEAAKERPRSKRKS